MQWPPVPRKKQDFFFFLAGLKLAPLLVRGMPALSAALADWWLSDERLRQGSAESKTSPFWQLQAVSSAHSGNFSPNPKWTETAGFHAVLSFPTRWNVVFYLCICSKGVEIIRLVKLLIDS